MATSWQSVVDNLHLYTDLDCSSQQWDEEGCTALAQCLRTNTTVTALSLHDHGIGDEGCKALAEVVPHSSVLML